MGRKIDFYKLYKTNKNSIRDVRWKKEDQIKKKKKYEFNEEHATKPYVKQVRLRKSWLGSVALKVALLVGHTMIRTFEK